MPTQLPLGQILSTASFNSQMELDYQGLSPVLEFTNSGRRGGGEKHFTVSLRSLLQSFKDIKSNLAFFTPNTIFVEETWRNLYTNYFTDQSVVALANTQPKPFFAVLSKIIHVANGGDGTGYSDSSTHLDENSINNVVHYLEAQIPNESLVQNASTVSPAAGKGVNIIYYGAPGTGKSHGIDVRIVENQTVRTVFHSDTQNSDFIGCLKPSVTASGEKREISYSFMPGPFAIAVAMALKNPTLHHWLVIEEINRAAAASVFGEVFQLLDRNAAGASQYGVTISDPSFCAYLKEQTGMDVEKLRIPSNLSILATMNSSDQGVLPMDTAFKRRWKFVYVPIDFTSAPEGDIDYTKVDGSRATVKWSTYAKALNRLMAARGIQEDRHIGPYFLNNDDLSSPAETLAGKLFIYLWDDVLRHGWRDLVFDSSIKTYGELARRTSSGLSIYSQEFLSSLERGESALNG